MEHKWNTPHHSTAPDKKSGTKMKNMFGKTRESGEEGVLREESMGARETNQVGENTIQLHVHFLSVEVVAQQNTSPHWISICYARPESS
jgi:hypothetical protein